MIHVVQFQWNQVMYQGTRVGPYKSSGIVSHTLKLSKGNMYKAKRDLLPLWEMRSYEKKTAMSSYQIKSLGIQLCTIFQLVSSFLMVVVKSQ